MRLVRLAVAAVVFFTARVIALPTIADSIVPFSRVQVRLDPFKIEKSSSELRDGSQTLIDGRISRSTIVNRRRADHLLQKRGPRSSKPRSSLSTAEFVKTFSQAEQLWVRECVEREVCILACSAFLVNSLAILQVKGEEQRRSTIVLPLLYSIWASHADPDFPLSLPTKAICLF